MLDQRDTSKMSDAQKEAAKKEVERKMKLDQDAEEDVDKKAERIAREKQEDFDDMMSGKGTRKRELSHSENLAELYKNFYDKTKSKLDSSKENGPASGSEFINTARSSIGSLGSKLEQRR
jgi:hypothetical protein